MNAIAAAFADQDWHASIARADLADWITVAAYALGAILALRAAATARSRERLFWRFTAALMAFFSVNELFDFQTIVTIVGRSWAVEQGWYEDRRVFQFEFIMALVAVAMAAGLALFRFTRGTHPAVRMALFGLVFIGLFVLIRAASFHHVSGMLGMGPEAFTIGSMQELLGIAIVALAACHYLARPRARRR
ncbi:hypothetical protein [Qipengyuania sediminis]|uniref:hypothetical protein n=1 Tax=Qipengyuania sediminis TaxID=1532023 RepID=UPI00105982D1|nr:hypothetical protein [Qipengyuania sediminis]